MSSLKIVDMESKRILDLYRSIPKSPSKFLEIEENFSPIEVATANIMTSCQTLLDLIHTVRLRILTKPGIS